MGLTINCKDLTRSRLEDLISSNIIAYEEHMHIRYQYIPSGLDVETTTLYQKDESGAVTYHFSFIYHWQFSINDICIVGRTLESLVDFLRLYEQCQEYDTIIFIQNESFEFSFIARELLKHDKVEVFARKKRKPLYFKYKRLTFLDSWQITGYSLEKIAKNYELKVQKMSGDLDYSLTRNALTPITEKEMQYNCNDVLVLSEFSKYYYSNYFAKGYMPITKTMIARRVMTDIIAELGCKKEVSDLIMKIYPRTIEQYDYIMSFFAGAFTHAMLREIGKVKTNGLHYDERSEYPSVIVFEYYPVSRFRAARPINYEKYLKEKCCLIDVTFRNIKTKTGITIISKNKSVEHVNCVWDNGRLYKGDSIRCHITEIDLKTLALHYDFEFKINSMLYADRGYLPEYVRDTIIKLYIEKERLRDMEDKKVEYSEAKKHLNSQYGSMCTRLNFINYIFTGEGWSEEPNDVNFKRERCIRNLAPQWSIYVTAHARKAILTMAAQLDGFWYSDTDSFFCDDTKKNRKLIAEYNKSLIDKHLRTMAELNIHCDDIDLSLMGTFAEEPAPKKFKTLGAKRYIQEYEKNGKTVFESTIAGLPKNALKEYCDKNSIDPFDYFDDNMKLTDIWSDKLCAYYCDDPRRELVTDYLGNTCEMYANGYVSLIPTTFNLKMDEDLKLLMSVES